MQLKRALLVILFTCWVRGGIINSKNHKISPKKAKDKSSDPMPAAYQSAVNFPIVGIGASAGGLEAVSLLMNNLP